MRPNRTRGPFRIAALVAAAATLAAVGAGVDYDLSWYSIDGGGGTSYAVDLELSGTIGQPDAGVMSGGDFELSGGFWVGGAEVTPPPCPADVDHDGEVSFNDLLAVLAAWGACEDCPEDIDANGVVDFNDLLVVLAAWGPCP